jgi:Peptidase family M23
VRRVTVWLSLAGSVAACLAAAVGCWLQTSVVGWVVNVAALAILMLLTVVYDRPGRHLVPRPYSWVYVLCGLAGLASMVRVGSLGWPHVSSTAMGLVVFTAVLLVYVVAGLREPLGGADDAAQALCFPFRSGRWTVLTGGLSALNHHLHVPSQTGALDLIAVRPDGARAVGVCPDRLEAYEAYGHEVLSPCAGVVVAVVDNLPDQAPRAARVAPPPGNHVRIDTGCSIVQLAHLRPGSVRVAEDDRVVAGERIGEVGNSGHSGEPHLHIHAERNGRGVRLRFTDAGRRRLRPGVVVTAPAGRTPA